MDAAALPAASTALAERCLRRRPDLGTLPAQVEELRSSLDTARTVLPGASSSLTTAELRLLPLLATHLTLAEIGQRLYLSKHTVKTQAISVYRKLGASSAARRSNGCRRSACSRGRPLTPSGRAHSFHPDRGMPVACLA
jgi:DNA-binding CsgD family transcriptional regulator